MAVPARPVLVAECTAVVEEWVPAPLARLVLVAVAMEPIFRASQIVALELVVGISRVLLQ
ncbi:hypothetical protein [Mycobacterium sp. E796]|uniref:hypothetical protein n=1 Tax=Mycobacterium sp. E796 TaxID=1834151 RepID=UPI000800C0A6|nr:hypothetical protein [Mycobacterium sp. E796]OBI48897.1 hypothetical protein A5706_02720 [Mycobacterium sp. E796]